MKSQVLFISLALLVASNANAEANPEKVCVNNKTGAAKFTNTLSVKKAECKKKESAEYYAQLQQVFDSGGTFVGYVYPNSSINPFYADIFIPSAGTELFIQPLPNLQTGDPGNLNIGIAVGYQTWKQIFYAAANCQGQQYIGDWNYGMSYRDPITQIAYQEKGTPTLVAPQSNMSFWYDAATNSWKDTGCNNTPGSIADAYLVSSPQQISLPFTTLQLPLVFGLLK